MAHVPPGDRGQMEILSWTNINLNLWFCEEDSNLFMILKGQTFWKFYQSWYKHEAPKVLERNDSRDGGHQVVSNPKLTMSTNYILQVYVALNVLNTAAKKLQPMCMYIFSTFV